MFGLSFEKLLVITIIASFVIGPQRLPLYAAKLAQFVRDLRAFVESTRARTETELGVPLNNSDWRRYDPRRIVRDALEDEPSAQAQTPAPTKQDATSPPA